jgi:hypothetical protein
MGVPGLKRQRLHPASRSPKSTMRSATALTDFSSMSVRKAFQLQACGQRNEGNASASAAPAAALAGINDLQQLTC